MANRRIRRWPDPPDSQGFSRTDDQNVILAESAALSIPPGSPVTVEQMLTDFPLQYVTNQRNARA